MLALARAGLVRCMMVMMTTCLTPCLVANYADDDKQWRQKDQNWNFLQSGIASARSDKNVDGDPF